MSGVSVAAFTDTYLPTVNGVTYTIKTWRERWGARGGRMDVVYPDGAHEPAVGEYPVRAVPFPFYEGFRVGLPTVPRGVQNVDIVHAHTPFTLGLAAVRLARREDLPLVASYHTPTAEYASYISTSPFSRPIEQAARVWERWFFNRVDVAIVPSPSASAALRDAGVTSRIEVVPNGVDTDFFRPPDAETVATFRDRNGLPEGPLIGYTGRHGYEKNLELLIDAVAPLDATLVLGGDGPARADLEAHAEDVGVDAHFLGFLDREDLPTFYGLVDVFGFPSPVETQGLVALESMACGTPVAAVSAGALSETVEDGVTGYTASGAGVEPFRSAIERTIDEQETLAEQCVAKRDEISVERAIDQLASVYESVT